jgi:hypothetical protein
MRTNKKEEGKEVHMPKKKICEANHQGFSREEEKKRRNYF